MRRPLIRLLVVALVLAALAGATGVLVSRLAPGWVHAQAEQALSDALGTPVSIGAARLEIGPRLRFHAEDVRAWSAPGGPALEVASSDAHINPIPLLLGRLRLRRVVLNQPRLRLERDASGAWTPAALPIVLGLGGTDAVAAGIGGAERLAAAIDDAVARALHLRIPAVSVEVRDGRLEITDASRPAPDGRPKRVLVDRVGLDVTPWAFGRGLTLELFARARDAHGPLGRFVLELRRERRRAARLSLRLTALDLSTLALAGARLPRPAAGRVTGELELASDGGPWRLDAALELHDVEAPLPAAGDGQRLTLDRVELRGRARARPGRIEVAELVLGLEDARARIAGSVGRPIGPDAHARLSLQLDPLELEQARRLLDALPGSLRAHVPSERVRGGRLAGLELEGRASLRRWPDLVVAGPRDDTEAFLLRAKLSDVRFELAEGDRLEQLSAEIAWSGHGLELRDAHATRFGEPLPRVDLTLMGVPHLLRGDPASRTRPPAVGPLPGVRPLYEVLIPRRSDGGEGGPTRLTVDADWIHHPALLWPVEQLLLVLERDARGASLALEHAIWGGVPISGDGRYTRGPEARLSIDLAARPPVPRPVPWRPARYWARGAFESDGFSLGPWTVLAAQGEFHAEGAALRLPEIDARCGPSTRQRGSAQLDLSGAEAVPLRSHFEIAAAPVSELAAALGLDPDHASGVADVSGAVRGRLHPGRHPLSDLSGTLSISARDGEIRRELPVASAIANASDRRTISARETVRFRAIDGELRLEDGRLELEQFGLDSPDLRVLVSGGVDLIDPLHPMEAVVGVLFFRTLDVALDRIPLLSDLILGRDKNLLCAYYKLTGPWGEPAADLIATKSLAEGPVQFVMGAPGFVRRGIAAIQSVVLPQPEDGAERDGAAARGS